MATTSDPDDKTSMSDIKGSSEANDNDTEVNTDSKESKVVQMSDSGVSVETEKSSDVHNVSDAETDSAKDENHGCSAECEFNQVSISNHRREVQQDKASKKESGQISEDNVEVPLSSETNQSVQRSCDFCEKQPIYSCENCSYFYCEACAVALHPAVGPFLRHSLVPAGAIMNPPRCEEHAQPRKLFCQVCQKRRCIDCSMSSCKLHFQPSPSKQDVEKEKDNLLAMMEKLTSAINSLNVYDSQVEEEILQIEMSALYKREQIRQEFVSFHELLIESEAALCKQLEQEVQESLLNIWRGQEDLLSNLRREETAMTTLTIDLLQTEDMQAFVKGTSGLHDRFRNLHSKIAGFHMAWAKGSIQAKRPKTPLLRLPFSLFLEKKQMNESIETISGQEPRVQFLQKMLFISQPCVPVRLGDLVSATGLGPSTTLKYHLQLYGPAFGKQGLVWESLVNSLQEIQLNTKETHCFESGCRYLLKLRPMAVCQMNARTQQTTACPVTHMLIVVKQFTERIRKAVRKIRR